MTLAMEHKIEQGDAIEWDTFQGQTMLGTFDQQLGMTVHASRMDGMSVRIDAIRCGRADAERLAEFARTGKWLFSK